MLRGSVSPWFERVVLGERHLSVFGEAFALVIVVEPAEDSLLDAFRPLGIAFVQLRYVVGEGYVPSQFHH